MQMPHSARQATISKDTTFKPALRVHLNAFVEAFRESVTNSQQLLSRFHRFEAKYLQKIGYKGEPFNLMGLNGLEECMGDISYNAEGIQTVTRVQPGGRGQPAYWVATDLLAGVVILGIKQQKHTVGSPQPEQVTHPGIVHIDVDLPMLLLQAWDVVFIGGYGAGKSTAAKAFCMELYQRHGVRHISVIGMGGNLSQQPWIAKTYELVTDFSGALKRVKEFKEMTKYVDSVCYLDDCTFPCHKLGGAGSKKLEVEYTAIGADRRTGGVDHIAATVWSAQHLTAGQRQNAQLMIAAGAANKNHSERRDDDEARNNDGLVDIKNEISSDLNFLKLSPTEIDKVARALQRGHEDERKKLLNFPPGKGKMVRIIQDGIYHKVSAEVMKVTVKPDGRRYFLNGTADDGTVFKMLKFNVEGQFTGRVFVNIRDPGGYNLYVRTLPALSTASCPGSVFHEPSPAPLPLPNAHGIKVDSSDESNGDDGSSDGETDEDAAFADDQDESDEESIVKQEANAAAEQAEEAAEKEGAKEKYKGEAKEGIADDDEEDAIDDDEEEEEEETQEDRDARLREEGRQELLLELQAAGGASATVSLHVSLKRCACLTHCIANLCMPHTLRC